MQGRENRLNRQSDRQGRVMQGRENRQNRQTDRIDKGEIRRFE